jgi:hypothetical protein
MRRYQLWRVRKPEKNYRENSKEDPEASVESIIKSFKNL